MQITVAGVLSAYLCELKEKEGSGMTPQEI